MILMLSVRLAAAAHAYLDAYAPTNILIRRLRDPDHRWFALPVSAVLMVTYGLLGAWLTTIINSGGPGWLNPLALLCAWSTIKFTWVALMLFFGNCWRVVRAVASLGHRGEVLRG
jgi:hypothetical protein